MEYTTVLTWGIESQGTEAEIQSDFKKVKLRKCVQLPPEPSNQNNSLKQATLDLGE